MNKIYKLLAVFLLFAALSAGSMTVQASEASAVAYIGSTAYTSLVDAITDANKETTAVEIDLHADVEFTEEISINRNVTLDLNGCTLTTSKDITVAPDGNVEDNSSGKAGRLILKENAKVNWTSNSQVPVYDANANSIGYAFATVTEQVYRKSEMGADAFELIFKPDFGALNNLMANGSIATNVDIGINLKWTDENGVSKTKELVYDDTMDEKVKNVYAANSEYSFYIKATGANSFDNLTITPIVMSELGTTWSKTKFDAAEEEPTAEYTITFLDFDGTQLSQQVYAANAAVTPPTDPTKTADSKYTFAFTGWTPAVAETATADATYTATYTATSKTTGETLKHFAVKNGGYTVFETEDVVLRMDNITVVESEAASGGKTVKTTAAYDANSSYNGSTLADIGFTFTADAAGTCYVWVRTVCTSGSSDYIFRSYTEDTYGTFALVFNSGTSVKPSIQKVSGSTIYSADETDYGWRRLSVSNVQAGKNYSVRLLSKEPGALLDRVILSMDANFRPGLAINYDPTVTTE